MHQTVAFPFNNETKHTPKDITYHYVCSFATFSQHVNISTCDLLMVGGDNLYSGMIFWLHLNCSLIIAHIICSQLFFSSDSFSSPRWLQWTNLKLESVKTLFGWQRMNYWAIFLSKLNISTRWSSADLEDSEVQMHFVSEPGWIAYDSVLHSTLAIHLAEGILISLRNGQLTWFFSIGCSIPVNSRPVFQILVFFWDFKCHLF